MGSLSLSDGYSMDSFQMVTYRVVVPILFSLITITGLVGNLLVLFVIISKKQMRTVTNLLILNLAFADILFISFVPLLTAFDYWHYSRWTIGLSACRFMHFIFNLTTYVTVYTLVLISIIRYMVVVHNAATVHLRTRQKVSVAIIIVWVVAFFLSIPIPFFYNVIIRCDVEISSGRTFELIFFTGGYIIPLITISFLYLCIIRHIYKHKSMGAMQARTRSDVKTKQAGKMLILVLVAFFILWMPIHIMLMLYYYTNTPQSVGYFIVGLVCNCLAYTNSVVNPFIYNHSSKDFRDAFKEVVCLKTSDDTCSSPTCFPNQKIGQLSGHGESMVSLGSKFNEDLANHNATVQARARSNQFDQESFKDEDFVCYNTTHNDNHISNDIKNTKEALALVSDTINNINSIVLTSAAAATFTAVTTSDARCLSQNGDLLQPENSNNTKLTPYITKDDDSKDNLENMSAVHDPLQGPLQIEKNIPSCAAEEIQDCSEIICKENLKKTQLIEISKRATTLPGTTEEVNKLFVKEKRTKIFS